MNRETIPTKVAKSTKSGDLVYLDADGLVRAIKYNKLERFVHRIGTVLLDLGNRMFRWRKKKPLGFYEGSGKVAVQGWYRCNIDE